MTRYLAAILALMLCGSAAWSQEQEKKQGITLWLRGLQQKIAQIKPKREVSLSTGVAGVRGAREDSQAKLYWKGKKGDEAVSEDELKEFKEIVGYLEKEDRAGAIHECEEFMKQHPDSALIPDVKKTLDLVRADVKEPGK